MNESTPPKAAETAVRVALWRALHVLVDPPPHIVEDTLGLRIAAPPEGWRDRRTWIPIARSCFARASSHAPASSKISSPMRPTAAAGFAEARHVTIAEIEARYFTGRDDGLRPSSGEQILVAST